MTAGLAAFSGNKVDPSRFFAGLSRGCNSSSSDSNDESKRLYQKKKLCKDHKGHLKDDDDYKSNSDDNKFK